MQRATPRPDSSANAVRNTHMAERAPVKSASRIALSDILYALVSNESRRIRLAKAKLRITRYSVEARAYFAGCYPSDRRAVGNLVSDSMKKLRDRVDEEIERRSRLKVRNEATDLLETLSDWLHDA